MSCRFYKDKQGFTVLWIYLVLILATYFLFMKQNENLLEVTTLYKKITTECRANDLIKLKVTPEETINLNPNTPAESRE